MFNVIENCYQLGHVFSLPVHKASYRCYKIIKAEDLQENFISKVRDYGECLLLIVAAGVSALFSVLFSSIGSTLLWFSNQNYLYENQSQNIAEETKKDWKILNYNVGFLPGELAQELTVGRFPMSSQQRKEAIVEFLFRKFQEVDVLLLEEVVDLGFMNTLKQRFSKEQIPSCLYYRIGHPLSLGICSGLAVVSKHPLGNFKVGSLPFSDPFFSRSFITFELSKEVTIIHTHLKAGDDDSPRLQQLKHIGRKVHNLAKGVLIGDFNFSDKITDFSAFFSHKIEPLITQPTISNPTEEESHPDFVATFGRFPTIPTVKILEDIRLSDHFPIEVEIEDP